MRGSKGCEVVAVTLEPEEAFHRAFKFQDFDISELSLHSYTMTTDRGDSHYVAIPAFVSRLFRDSGIYIRTDRGITCPEDLKGKTIGLLEYQITANVWIRGFLQDEYGVKPSEIKWRCGGLEEAGRDERTPIKLPANIDLDDIPKHRTLSDMLASGDFDGLNGAPNVDRLFPDYPKVEEAYFRKTRIFPIMHTIGIRRSLIEKYPWLATSVYKAFLKAKDLCMHELNQIGHLSTSLPLSVAENDPLKKFMGEDYWSYGVEANRHVLETLVRYSFEQACRSENSTSTRCSRDRLMI